MNLLDKTLINSIKNGDTKSFEIVFKTYYSRLCTYAYGYTKQIETAEDIVKDFFIDFWEKKEKIEIKISLSGYLFRSVHNACINYLKRKKNKNITSLAEDLSIIELKLKQPLSNDYPAGNLLAKELEEQILELVKQLPQQCKKIFELSRFDGLSHKKIAKKLNISENTVKVQIFRALKKIKEGLILILFLFFTFF